MSNNKPTYTELEKLIDEQKLHIDKLEHKITELLHFEVVVQGLTDAADNYLIL